jgi:hypothetical protein
MEDAMKDEKTVDRREFTLAAALAALSGVVITISASACGGGSSPSSPSTPAPTPSPSGGGGAATDKTGVIGSNHGHGNAVITAAQLTAPAQISLDIRGQADHPHTLTLTAAEVASIAANQRISKESSSDNGHSHSVTFN